MGMIQTKFKKGDVVKVGYLDHLAVIKDVVVFYVLSSEDAKDGYNGMIASEDQLVLWCHHIRRNTISGERYAFCPKCGEKL